MRRSFLTCRRAASLRLMFTAGPQGHQPLHQIFRDNYRDEGERKRDIHPNQPVFSWMDGSPKFPFVVTGKRWALPEGGRAAF